MHFSMIIVQNWGENRLRSEKLAPSESRSGIFRVLKKSSAFQIGLFLGKIRSFLMKISQKMVFSFQIGNSKAFRHPLQQRCGRFPFN